MKFRYEIQPPVCDFKLRYHDRIATIGSCFSENIGEKFLTNGFEATVNPYGTLFNPLSIANALHEIISDKKYTAADLQYTDGVYFSYQHYTRFSDTDSAALIKKIQAANATSLAALKQAKVLFITLGTALGFYLKKENKLVANCHKQPHHLFEQRLIAAEETVRVFSTLIEGLHQLNPSLRLIFTVSPVRYFALGIFENSVAKAQLFSAIYMLKQKYPFLLYFPAYELVVDDLRDYRFYKDDLLHPNELAIHYIWQKLSDSLLDEAAKNYMRQYAAIRSLQQHTVMNALPDAISRHNEIIDKKIAAFEKEFGIAYRHK